MYVAEVDINNYLVTIWFVLVTATTRYYTDSACENWHLRRVSRTWTDGGCVAGFTTVFILRGETLGQVKDNFVGENWK